MLGLRAAHRTVRTLGVGPVVLIHHCSNGPGAGGPGPGHALASRIFNKAESGLTGQVWSGQVRFITRPKSRTMRAKRKKRPRANRTKVPK